MEDRPDSGEPGWIGGKRVQHDVVKGMWLLAAGCYVERVLRDIIFGKNPCIVARILGCICC